MTELPLKTLIASPFCPFSRTARLCLAEKRLPFTIQDEPVFEQRPGFLVMNPAGVLPVLIDDTAQGPVQIVEIRAIIEYLEETAPEVSLMPADPVERAEVRRILNWVERKYDAEVNGFLLFEKIEKRQARSGYPEPQAIRAGVDHLRVHLDYFSWLLGQRDWLAGPRMTVADLAAAAHISCADYLGDVRWSDFPLVKEWFARIKHRPSFRPLLSDSLVGIVAPAHYADLDF
jgi:glutathione S-transferase